MTRRLAVLLMVVAFLLPAFVFAAESETQWAEFRPLTIGRSGAGVVPVEVSAGNFRIYMLGGYITAGHNATTENYYYHPQSQKAYGVAAFPGKARANSAVVLKESGKIYMVGGHLPFEFRATDEVWRLDYNSGATGQWVEEERYPYPISHAAAAMIAGGVYVMGGATIDQEASSRVWWSNGGAWTEKASMNARRMGHASVLYKNRIYVIGGRYKRPESADVSCTNDPQNYLCSAEYYDPANDSWTRTWSLPAPMARMSVATDGDYIYVVGGSLQQDDLDPKTNWWGYETARTLVYDENGLVYDSFSGEEVPAGITGPTKSLPEARLDGKLSKFAEAYFLVTGIDNPEEGDRRALGTGYIWDYAEADFSVGTPAPVMYADDDTAAIVWTNVDGWRYGGMGVIINRDATGSPRTNIGKPAVFAPAHGTGIGSTPTTLNPVYFQLQAFDHSQKDTTVRWGENGSQRLPRPGYDDTNNKDPNILPHLFFFRIDEDAEPFDIVTGAGTIDLESASPSLGSLSASSGTLKYTPSPDANGLENFTFTINEESARCIIAITPVNDPPRVKDGQHFALAIEVTEDTTHEEWLHKVFEDPEGDPMFVEILEQPSHGTVVGMNVTNEGAEEFGYRYTPDDDYCNFLSGMEIDDVDPYLRYFYTKGEGDEEVRFEEWRYYLDYPNTNPNPDPTPIPAPEEGEWIGLHTKELFVLRIRDIHGALYQNGTDQKEVDVKVNHVNDPPVALGDSGSVLENHGSINNRFVDIDVLDNDYDVDFYMVDPEGERTILADDVTLVSTSVTSGGGSAQIVTEDGRKKVRYTPTSTPGSDTSANAIVSYAIRDQFNAETTADINVLVTRDRPIARNYDQLGDFMRKTQRNNWLIADPLGNDYDNDKSTLFIVNTGEFHRADGHNYAFPYLVGSRKYLMIRPYVSLHGAWRVHQYGGGKMDIPYQISDGNKHANGDLMLEPSELTEDIQTGFRIRGEGITHEEPSMDSEIPTGKDYGMTSPFVVEKGTVFRLNALQDGMVSSSGESLTLYDAYWSRDDRWTIISEEDNHEEGIDGNLRRVVNENSYGVLSVEENEVVCNVKSPNGNNIEVTFGYVAAGSSTGLVANICSGSGSGLDAMKCREPRVKLRIVDAGSLLTMADQIEYSPAGRSVPLDSLISDGGAQIFSMSDPENGRIENQAGVVTFVPDDGFNGKEAITYNLMKEDGTTLSRIVTIEVADDTDADGIADKAEYGPASDTPEFDGNGDGAADSSQAHVASFKTKEGDGYVTLVVPEAANLEETAAEFSRGDAPSSIKFPFGLVDFKIDDFTDDGTLELILPEGTEIDTYWKYGPTPDNGSSHWYEFLYDGTTGAEIDGNRVTLHFVDGKRGDDDLKVNNKIVDIGGPAIRTVSTDPGSGGSAGGVGGSGGGSCFVDMVAGF